MCRQVGKAFREQYKRRVIVPGCVSSHIRVKGTVNMYRTHKKINWTDNAERAGLRVRCKRQSYGWGFVPTGFLNHGHVYIRLSEASSMYGEWPEGLREKDLVIVNRAQVIEIKRFQSLRSNAW